jgi:long-chain fatty acid transport protein
MMKHLVRFLAISVLMIAMSLGLYSNGLNLNGNGSKAIAMGGAFIGLADDYSAVFWNPAGLTQMKETQLSFFFTDIIPKGTYQWDLVGIDTTTETKHYPSGGIGFFKPLSEKLVIGVYAHVPSGIGGVWKGDELAILSGGAAFEWSSKVGIFSFSPAVAYKVSDQFSLGVAFNVNYGLLKLKRPTDLGQYEEDLNGLAFNATLGMLFKPSEKFSIGVSFKTPMKVKVKGDVTLPGAALLGLPGMDEGERSADWPMWFGAGIAFKPTDNLTFTMDAQYTNWKKMDTIPMAFTNAGWIAFLESGVELQLRWKNAVQWRFGLEYKLSDAFALRGGFYIDPIVSPIDTHNILLPELGYKWVTFGFGYTKGNITLDVGVEYGMGKDEEVPFGLYEDAMPGIHGMDILVPNIALTIRL